MNYAELSFALDNMSFVLGQQGKVHSAIDLYAEPFVMVLKNLISKIGHPDFLSAEKYTEKL